MKKAKPAPQEPGHSEEALTGKQLQAKLKREANKLQKEEQKKAKKEEAARKREAQATTKKVVQLSSKLSSKLSVPLTPAVHKAHGILQKADSLGLKDADPVKEFQDCVEVIEEWKKKCASALNFYAKNPKCELAALPFATDKNVSTL